MLETQLGYIGTEETKLLKGGVVLHLVGLVADHPNVTGNVALSYVNPVQRWGVGAMQSVSDENGDTEQRTHLGDLEVFLGNGDFDVLPSGTLTGFAEHCTSGVLASGSSTLSIVGITHSSSGGV